MRTWARAPAPRGRRGLRAKWWRRVVNGLRPDHNPLRRSVDRLESVLILGAIALFLVATPLIGLGVGRWAWSGAAATAGTE